MSTRCLDEVHPEIEWHSALHALMGGKQTVFRGHDGVRRMIGDLYEAFAEVHIEMPVSFRFPHEAW